MSAKQLPTPFLDFILDVLESAAEMETEEGDHDKGKEAEVLNV